VMKLNFELCIDKMRAIAARLNISDVTATPSVFEKMIIDIGLPTKLRDLGVTKQDLEPLAEKAMNDHCTPTNPRAMTIDDFVKLYTSAW
jgi:alcohol dehydrogenase class IV